jgi:KDO2-lipid IV(A) lauroyltransferase
VVRHILQNKKSKIPFVLAFIADQTPSVNNLHYWTNFLNQDTPFLTGWEAIARKTDDYVVFLNVHRKKRGYYHCYIELISASPAQTAEFELTEKYARLMERNILENPAYWLWSHRRWKHQRKE